MLYEPAQQIKEDGSSNYKMVVGVWMFLIYAFVYSGFVAINVIKPVLMEKHIFLGLNLAVVYGFALIVFAMILALIYNKLCTIKERKVKQLESQEELK